MPVLQIMQAGGIAVTNVSSAYLVIESADGANQLKEQTLLHLSLYHGNVLH